METKNFIDKIGSVVALTHIDRDTKETSHYLGKVKSVDATNVILTHFNTDVLHLPVAVDKIASIVTRSFGGVVLGEVSTATLHTRVGDYVYLISSIEENFEPRISRGKISSVDDNAVYVDDGYFIEKLPFTTIISIDNLADVGRSTQHETFLFSHDSFFPLINGMLRIRCQFKHTAR